MQARIGDRGEPVGELPVQVVEIAEAAGEEEVLADVAERPLEFTLGLGPVRSTGSGMEPMMAGEVDERAVVPAAMLVCIFATSLNPRLRNRRQSCLKPWDRMRAFCGPRYMR
jgi:hypothetical protein